MAVRMGERRGRLVATLSPGPTGRRTAVLYVECTYPLANGVVHRQLDFLLRLDSQKLDERLHRCALPYTHATHTMSAAERHRRASLPTFIYAANNSHTYYYYY